MINEQREFWSKVAQDYDRVVDLQIGGQTRSMVRQRLGGEPALGSTVEFGCGTGFYTETLADKADRLMATDLSPRMLDLARSQRRRSNTWRAPTSRLVIISVPLGLRMRCISLSASPG